MKRPPGRSNPGLERADAPTLALSTAPLDAARLRQVLVFERTLRHLAPAGCSPEETARAHGAAIAASGLASSEVQAPLALLRRFAANRSLSAHLTQRLAALSARASTDGVAAEQSAEIQTRLAALGDALKSREDGATLRLLEAHSAEILALFAATHPGV